MFLQACTKLQLLEHTKKKKFQVQAFLILLPASMNLNVLYIKYMRNNVIFVFWGLDFFT
jgi:hypothetical protein